MLTILSPAKRMEISLNNLDHTIPQMLEQTKDLMKILKSYNSAQLQKLMKISPKLADLNFQRHMDFDLNHTTNNSSQAIFTYRGDAYRGLDIASFDENELDFTNSHLRILTGLYGLLSPYDLIQPYRLEMGTKLKNKKGKNLYEFWGDTITSQINKALKKSDSKVLINLASDEYYKAINPDKIDGEIVKVIFKEHKGDKLKVISIFAKKARGMMTRYIMKNKINDKESLKGFDYEGYYFKEELSSSREYWFVR